jgi:GTP-binding protein
MDIDDIHFVKGATKWGHFPVDGRPEVAVVGRSNVGKSSLVNMLVGRRAIARISGTPGKTQEFNFYLVNDAFYLVDLPGYGYAKVARTQREYWGRFIGSYLQGREELKLVLHLIDSRHSPTSLDRDVMSMMRQSPVPYVIALTKTDKLSGNTRIKSVREVQKVTDALAMEVPVVLTSAEDRRGRDELLTWIDTMIAT